MAHFLQNLLVTTSDMTRNRFLMASKIKPDEKKTLIWFVTAPEQKEKKGNNTAKNCIF